jgi:hypothetical protein
MGSSKNTITRINKESESDLDPRCCQTGCPDCPYGFQDQFNPDIPIELQKGNPTQNFPDEFEKYLDIDHYEELND